MKKFLLAVAALLCVGSVAMAGVNANGTVLFHYNATATGTDGSYSGYGGLQSCESAIIEAPGDTPGPVPGAWFAYAAFLPTAHPRVAVITAGLLYDESMVFISTWGKTADGELPTTSPAWPLNGSGIAVQWDVPRTSTLFEWYWFTGYGYTGGMLCLGPHPTQGGGFTDDSVPATTDPITAYGCLGFGVPGVLACPTETIHQGACCLADGSCIFVLQSECEAQGGTYQGDDVTCNSITCPPPPPPTGACCIATECVVLTQQQCVDQGGLYQGDDVPCAPETCATPVKDRSWGQIKNSYR